MMLDRALCLAGASVSRMFLGRVVAAELALGWGGRRGTCQGRSTMWQCTRTQQAPGMGEVKGAQGVLPQNDVVRRGTEHH